MLSALIGDNCASDVPLGISRSAIDATVWREAAVRWLLCRGTSVIILVAVVLIGVIRTREIVCTRRHLALARIIQISILVSYLPFHHPPLPDQSAVSPGLVPPSQLPHSTRHRHDQ